MTITRPVAGVIGLRLGVFIAASVAVHALLLAGSFQGDNSVTAASVLAVKIVAPEAHETKPEPIQAPRKHTSTSPAVGAASAANEVVEVKSAFAAEAAATTPDVEATPSTPTTETAAPSSAIETPLKPLYTLEQRRQELRTQLHHDLARHFRYPRLAIKRGWEGTVLLDLQIETDGKISRISLAHSSGHTLLDNSAIATLQSVAQVADAARWLEGERMELQLPVTYRLTSSMWVRSTHH